VCFLNAESINFVAETFTDYREISRRESYLFGSRTSPHFVPVVTALRDARHFVLPSGSLNDISALWITQNLLLQAW
jgi:hypothetical protein